MSFAVRVSNLEWSLAVQVLGTELCALSLVLCND